jgi:hypothetical protein
MGITATYDKQRLDSILREQYNVVTRQQLLACGMTRSAIQHRVAQGGRWRIILPGIYAASDGSVSAAQREMAALLHAGPEATITGAFAARHHGLVASGPDYIDVLVPVDVRRQSIRFVRLIRTARMPAKTWRAGHIRVTAPARAVADAVRSYRDIHDARSLICAAVQQQKCTFEELATELREGPKRGSAILLQGLRDAARGIWSSAEGKLMNLIERSDLPQPEYNVALYAADGELLGIVDAWWERAGVAAEVDSQEFHFKRDDWLGTMKRSNRITRRRVQLMHFAPYRVDTDKAGVIAELRDAIAEGLAAPPLPIRGVPAGVREHADGAIDTL